MTTAPRRPDPTDRAKAAEDFDAKYRRCMEHNRARYWCGCYFRAAAAAPSPATPKTARRKGPAA